MMQYRTWNEYRSAYCDWMSYGEGGETYRISDNELGSYTVMVSVQDPIWFNLIGVLPSLGEAKERALSHYEERYESS